MLDPDQHQRQRQRLPLRTLQLAFAVHPPPGNSTPPDRIPRLSTSLSFLLLLRHEFVVVLPRFYVSLGSHHACALLVTGCSRVHAHVCVCARVCACTCVHVRVCACVCEREGEREGGADACVIDFVCCSLVTGCNLERREKSLSSLAVPGTPTPSGKRAARRRVLPEHPGRRR